MLCEEWKKLWPLRWREKIGRHRCSAGQCRFERVLEDVRLAQRFPEVVAQHFDGEEDDLWLCCDSGLPHLCGVSDCDCQTTGADLEPTCTLTGRVLGPRLDFGWQYAPRYLEKRKNEWVSAPRLTTHTVSVTAAGAAASPAAAAAATSGAGPRAARGRRFEVLENEWRRFAESSEEELGSYLLPLCTRGWCPNFRLEAGSARSWGSGSRAMLARASRLLACVFARTPEGCPYEQRILRIRAEVAKTARRFALDPERGLAALAAVAEETWVPRRGRDRVELVSTLARGALGLWAHHLRGELEIRQQHGGSPAFEKFVLAAARILGSGVDVEIAGVRFASLETDPRFTRLPIAEVSTLLGDSREAHEALVSSLRDGITRAARARPSIFRGLYYRMAPEGRLASRRRHSAAAPEL